MVNQVILIGRLTADPEIRLTPKGLHIANLRLATSSHHGKEEDGTRKEHSEFHSLVAFGRQAEVIGEYLRRGRLLFVSGRLQTRTWDDSEGKRHWATEVVIEEFQMLSPKASASEAA